MEDENKKLTLSLKITIIVLLIVGVIFGISIYSRNLEKNSFSKETDLNSNKDQLEDLVNNYQKNLKETLNNFNGDYRDLQNKIIDLIVPSGFQELHLNLVIALNDVVYEDNPKVAQMKLEKIANQNQWIKSSMTKIISSLE